MVIITAPLRGTGQNYEWRSLAYNTISSSLIAGASSLINKKKDQKTWKTVFRAMSGGALGGSLMYAGKKANRLIILKEEISYAWLSRLVFCAGNSIVENAARDLPLFSIVHYDLGFVRMQYNFARKKFHALVMPSSFVSFVLLFSSGRFDEKQSLKSGVPVFLTQKIWYAKKLSGSTTGNGFILTDTLQQSNLYHEIFAHEMIHTFQFMEHSAVNYFFIKPVSKWKEKYEWYGKASRWVHGDLNYQAMLLNYFLIQGGYKRSYYCKNFLENEAEWLATKRVSCPAIEIK